MLFSAWLQYNIAMCTMLTITLAKHVIQPEPQLLAEIFVFLLLIIVFNMLKMGHANNVAMGQIQELTHAHNQLHSVYYITIPLGLVGIAKMEIFPLMMVLVASLILSIVKPMIKLLVFV
jgi:hypothetical protein